MNTIAISQLRNNLPSIVNNISLYLKRLVISVSGEPKVVLMSLEELESLEETAEILSVPNAYKKIMTSSPTQASGYPHHNFSWSL